jgi:hypothetical protein
MAHCFSLCPRDSAAVLEARPIMLWPCNGGGHELTETVGSLCQTLTPGIWGILLRSAMFPQHGALKQFNRKLHAIVKRCDITYIPYNCYWESKHYLAYRTSCTNTYHLFVFYTYSTNSVITYPLEHTNFSVKIFPAFHETRKHVIGFSLVHHWSLSWVT